MTELWRLAATDQVKTPDGQLADVSVIRTLAAERDSLVADAKALQTLNQDLQRQRSTSEKSLAEARALLSHRDAALGKKRFRAASLEQALVKTRMEPEALLDRRRITLPRAAAPTVLRKPQRRKRPAVRTTNVQREICAARLTSRQTCIT